MSSTVSTGRLKSFFSTPLISRILSTAVVAATCALANAPTAASAQGLTWTVTPGARWIDWDKALPFDESRLLGGSMGIGFGRYVGLEAFHHEESDLSLFSNQADAPTVDVAQSGARVTLAFGTGTLVPIVGGGASLLRFRPDGGERTRKLSLDYGGGLRIVLAERLQGEVALEKTRYFFDAATLLDPTLPTPDDARENLTLRAGLGIQLGRRSFDRSADLDDSFAQRYQAPFAGFALAIEPVIGRLDFDGATGLARQDMVGVRAGLDFGSFFGVRAFHWWGTEDDFRTTNGFRIIGGEAQFNLAAGPGLTPFLTGGAGQLHWTPRGNGVNPAPADQTAIILGGGVDFNFGRRIRASISARDYILGSADLTADPDLGSVVDPDDLIHNWQVSAGLKLVLGGSGGLIRSAVPQSDVGEIAPEPTDARAGEPVVETAKGAAVAGDPAVKVEPVEAAGVAPAAGQPAAGQPAVRTADAPLARTAGAPATPAPAGQPVSGAADGRNIIIPVPETGELYVRFGDPRGATVLGRALAGDTAGAAAGAGAAGTAPAGSAASLTAEELREIIREEFRTQVADSLRATPDTAQAAAIRRLEARIDSLTRVIRERPVMVPAAAPAAAGGQVPAAAPAAGAGGAQAAAIPSAMESAPIDRSLRETRFFTGFATTGPSQILLGLATDIGPVTRKWDFLSLVPSIAIGFGDSRPTYLAALSAEYRFGGLPLGSMSVAPMVSVGAGVFRGRSFEAVVPTFVGASLEVDGGALRAFDNVFFGLQGVDFMNGGRFLVGLRRTP